jgi:hypothetical protein
LGLGTGTVQRIKADMKSAWAGHRRALTSVAAADACACSSMQGTPSTRHLWVAPDVMLSARDACL